MKKLQWLYVGIFSLVISLLPTTGSFSQSINLLAQGRNLYQSGRFAEAIAVWQTAGEQYSKQGDGLNQALSLSYLSLAQQELNQWIVAEQSIQQSLKILQAKPQADAILWAQVLNTQATLQLHTGKAELAIATWEQAQKFYQQAGDKMGSLGSQINQAQGLQSLGFYRRSQQQLLAITQKLQATPDDEIKVSGLRSLGLALKMIGDPNSQAVLTESLAIARKIGDQPYLSSILFSLGKTAIDAQNPQLALDYFNQAEQSATNPLDGLQGRLARFQLFLDNGHPELAAKIALELVQQLEKIPPSHNSLYAAINFAANLNRQSNPQKILPIQDLSRLLANTVKSAQLIQDSQAEAYALYQWGQLYRHPEEWVQAQELTEKSLNIARQIQSEDIIAQSAGQLGKLYKQQGETAKAINSYTEAIKSLKALRGDLIAVNPDVQFSFRESVEPIYRDLVGLLLDHQPNQNALRQARELIESLQIAELDNFFREACLDRPKQIDQVDPSATIIYPIILPDRLAVILSSAGKPLRYYVTYKSQADIEQTLDNFLIALNPVSDSQDRLRSSEQIYDWLIRLGERDQAFKDTKTLVFVLDSKLRNIPMSALYDGKQYLIEKYAVALSPGLQLIASPSFQQHKIKAIIGGISDARPGFSALPFVESEVNQISQTLPSSLLLNQKFTSQALADLVKSSHADIVHLATHGQFSSRIEDTYLLTWNGQVDVKELSELLKNRSQDSGKAIELLVLSACDTAAGDDRAVLGLAGLAVKSGARSTIATLWPVKDKAAEILMTQFYQQLQKPKITKAEALRQAQINLIRQTDFYEPFFWSAFVLVGNWL